MQLSPTSKSQISSCTRGYYDADAALTYEALNLSLDLTIGTGIDMEMTRDPQRSKGTADLNIGLMGQEQTIKGTFFTDKNEDNSRTTYIKWGDGNWKQKTEKSDESEESLENSMGLKGLPNSIAQGIAVMTAISDKSVQAELKGTGSDQWQGCISDHLHNSGSSPEEAYGIQGYAGQKGQH